MVKHENVITKAIVIRRILLGVLNLIILASLTFIAVLVRKGKEDDDGSFVFFLVLGWAFGLMVFFGIIIPKKFHHLLYRCGMKVMKDSDYYCAEPENLAFKKSRILGIIAGVFSIIMFAIAIILGIV